MTTALIMSGGGARGAYEVGVLSYLYGDLAPRHGLPRVDLVSGTSVGAINGSFLASVIHDPIAGMARLAGLWRGLEISDVMGFGMLQARRLHRVLLGGRRGAGFFDATPMSEIIKKGVSWRQLAKNIRADRLRALTITATHIPTGRPVCFVDRAPGTPVPRALPREIRVRLAHIMPHHVLASAAIPVVFPPVFIRTDLYCDGGLRLNTPLAPAIHMGAERVLVIGMSTRHETRSEIPKARFPGLPFLLGKVLDAFLLDHVNLDLEELDRVNAFLEDGVAAYGPSFIERTNEVAIARGAPPRRLVTSLAIHPSEDIGQLAAAHLRRERSMMERKIGRSLLRLLDVGEGADSADLASYLLFDGTFAAELIELGRRDAAARRDELVEFLYG
ncbi:MAG TPA: patatin-like phospholipase family protein [Sandaracinaceae bacterium LLY-WYZ-13_1]|nr:patatin-like phospholipase family protein [Sandaracinaceae bacterium LLY-WYZ-13_1]